MSGEGSKNISHCASMFEHSSLQNPSLYLDTNCGWSEER